MIKHKTRLIITTLISIILLLIIAIIFWYNKTSNWDNLKFNNKLSELPPEFVSDNRSVELDDDISILKKLDSEIITIQKKNNITNNSQTIINETKALINKYKLNNGQVINNYNKLLLYIDIYSLKKTAYENTDYEKLNTIYNKLTKQVLNYNNDFDKVLQNDLSQIVSDYNELSKMITQITNLGELKNNKLYVNENIVDDNIDFTKLNKFKYIKSLEQLWNNSNIIQNNKLLTDEQNWNNKIKKIQQINLNNYIQVKDITTLKDAKQFTVTYDEEPISSDYKLDDDSPVIKITYNNEILAPSKYIKKNNDNIIVHIKAIYKKKNKEERVEIDD